MDMTKYVKSMIEDFPDKLEGVGKFPWTDKLFTVDKNRGNSIMIATKAKIFHTFVLMKEMILCKRGRQTIQPGITFLATSTTEPNEGDWAKLIKIVNFLNATHNEVESMSADNTQSIKWHFFPRISSS